MNHVLPATILVAALAVSPAIASANNFENAHERCKRDEDNRQILGGVAGAVLGAVVGSQVAGSGARTEGSWIAGSLGALAGVGIADKSIDCDPVYPEQQQTHSQQSYSQPTSYSSSSQPVYSSGSTASYGGSQSYQGQTYQDRVTVSDHPVYSNPSYGASTAQYSSGTQYASAGNYTSPDVTTYASAPTTTSTSTSTYVSQPAVTYASTPTYSSASSYQTPSYSRSYHDPQFRTVRTSYTHAHGPVSYTHLTLPTTPYV